MEWGYINIYDNRCDSDPFFNYNLNAQGCNKCDDERGGGMIVCNPEKGCSHIAADIHLYCNSCKTGYFLYDWQCIYCSNVDRNCLVCYFNSTENKFKCNKCINNEFYINETGLCDIIITSADDDSNEEGNHSSNNNIKLIIIVNCNFIY